MAILEGWSSQVGLKDTDNYMIVDDPDVVYIKNKLDILSELLYNYHFLSKALFTMDLDRQACYNAFKGFMDIIRFNNAACSENLDLKTRHETITCASDSEDARTKSSILELLRWREVNFSLSDAEACIDRIRNAYSVAFDILNALSESIVSGVTKLDGTLRLFEVEKLEDAAKENFLHPVSIEPKWTIVSEEIRREYSPNVTGVWLSHFYFFIITDNAIGSRLHKVADTTSAIFKKYNLTSPDYYRIPVIITENMLRALLCSCYTLNPYLYYDCIYSDTYINFTNMWSITEPPHQLLFAMAREALSIQAISIRQDYTIIPDMFRLYRSILKILRLKVFISFGKVIVPHERVFDYYKYSYSKEAGWIDVLKHYSEQSLDAVKVKREGPLIDYYPKIRSLIDSMDCVFDSALTPDRFYWDKP
jgi:hypothetical protein